MTCSVVTEKPGVPASEMKDGDLAAIVAFPDYTHFIGKVCQRGANKLICVLGVDGNGRFREGAGIDNIRVRILHSGDTIRID